MFSPAISVVAPARRLLLAALAVSALFTLRAEAQTAPPPCETASAPAFAIANLGTQSPIAAVNCGAAGQTCLCGQSLQLVSRTG